VKSQAARRPSKN